MSSEQPRPSSAHHRSRPYARARVGIIGAGVGGLSAAIRLAAAGHRVDVYERRSDVGGKLTSHEIDGYRFDLGPSLLTLPQVFRELFSVADASFDDTVDLRRLDPAFRYTFADGSTFDVHDDAGSTFDAIASLAGTSAANQWQQFMQRSRRSWDAAERTFFAGPLDSPLQSLRRLRSLADLVAIDPLRTLAQRSRSAFDDVRLQQWLNRYATYSGSSPWLAPAALACIPHIEQQFGSWHVMGGVSRVADALEKLAIDVGVSIHTNVDVRAVRHDGERVTGLDVDDASVDADIVVANCDAEHLYGSLVPNASRLRRVHRAERSSSGFALLLGLRGTTPGIAHHNIQFSADQRREFDQIFSNHEDGVSDDPTIYVCNSSATDPSQAPEGGENWFVLVNVRAGAGIGGNEIDWETYADRIIARLGVAHRIANRSMLTPADLQARYRSPGGAIYGASSNGRRAAFLRASNRGPLRGLYLTGGSAHPGGGLPLVAMSGAIVAALVNEDLDA